MVVIPRKTSVRPRRVVLAALLALAGLAAFAANAGAAEQDAAELPVLPGTESIVICHASGNTFVQVESNVSSIVEEQGHGTKHGNDIIPRFRFRLEGGGREGLYPGRNWDAEGQAIWANGCTRPPPPTPETIEVFACVDVHNGSFDATFGYNSNTAVTIPVGSDNEMSPAPPDRGQETEFRHGKVIAAFTVRDVTESRLTWTVTHGGQTSSVTVDRSSNPCDGEKEPTQGPTEEPFPPAREPAVPIGVFVTCVTDHGSTFDAVFGYDSENLDPHTIPVGPANQFTPGHENRDQPTTFKPGHHSEAVEVTGIPRSVVLRWTLSLTDTRSAAATADFNVKCEHPTPEPEPVGIFATCATRHGSTYDAVFGYLNENSHSLTIPIGSRNSIGPGHADQGQPEVFAPGFVNSAFAVRGVPVSRPLTWRLELHHHGTRVAVADANLPACLTAPLDPVSQATISKSVTPGRITVGRNAFFRIVLRNDGSTVLAPAVVGDTLRGARLRVIDATPTSGACQVESSAVSHTVRCHAPTLAPGESLTVRITVTALAPGTARDRAAIVHFVDSTPGDNSASAVLRIGRPPPPQVTG